MNFDAFAEHKPGIIIECLIIIIINRIIITIFYVHCLWAYGHTVRTKDSTD